ncbi:class III lanthipeptide [Bacillus manliponensis]
MKDVLALQQLNEEIDVQPEWPTATMTSITIWIGK